MSGAHHVRPPRLRGGGPWVAALGLVIVCPTPVLAGECGAFSATVELGTERSQWEERNAQGQRLVRETGTLSHHRLSGDLRCADVNWTLAWGLTQGERRYDGLTNTGTGVLSSSDLRAQELLLSAWMPVQGGWSVGGRLGQAQTQRYLQSTASALGYPEWFRHWHAGVGLRFQHPLSDDILLTASGWLGGGPGGSVRVGLPGYAPVNLPLGRSLLTVLSLELSSPLTSWPRGWRWNGGLAYQQQAFSAGTAQVLLKAGQPSGVAWQPESSQRQLRWTVGISHSFD